MKHLLTIISCFIVLSLSAQTDYPFPWNPDADLDGWVSTEDLLQLLTVFGTQFEPDTWETDSISAAVVLDGNHNYFQCQSYCNDIEGNWRMADLDAFGRHFELASSVSAYFWVNGNDKLNSSDFAYDTYQLYGPTGDMANVSVSNFSQAKKCMCYIQSSPFVPSQFTEDSNLALWGSVSDLQEQVDSLQSLLDSVTNWTANDTVSPSANGAEYSIECVEMGWSPLCPSGLGVAEWVTLGPEWPGSWEDGYVYFFNGDGQLTSDNLLGQPKWRKFKISGEIPADTQYLLLEGYRGSIPLFEEVELFTENGERFFYVYDFGSSNTHCGWGPPIDLPDGQHLNIGANFVRISIYVPADGSFLDTGIRVKMKR